MCETIRLNIVFRWKIQQFQHSFSDAGWYRHLRNYSNGAHIQGYFPSMSSQLSAVCSRCGSHIFRVLNNSPSMSSPHWLFEHTSFFQHLQCLESELELCNLAVTTAYLCTMWKQCKYIVCIHTCRRKYKIRESQKFIFFKFRKRLFVFYYVNYFVISMTTCISVTKEKTSTESEKSNTLVLHEKKQ